MTTDEAVCNQTKEKLAKAAQRIMQNAYAPYSKFKVGAAILTDQGNTYVGCNVENAAYPIGSCAEAAAICAMVAAGETTIRMIAVAGLGESLCTPCGGCRQRIREFAAEETPVLICDGNSIRRETTLNELLPLSFGPDNLMSKNASSRVVDKP